MLVCRKSRADADLEHPSSAPQQGGPVFLPRRRLSPLAEKLLAHRPLAVELVTVGDEPGCGGDGLPAPGAGRPVRG